MDKIASSFRDPSGFMFSHEGRLLRQINLVYKENYDLLMRSGLYRKLVDSGDLVPHEEIDPLPGRPEAYKFIEPRRLPFISYPYEWCFSQLRDAALLTLRVQKEALNHDLSLKDASSFNIQFFEGQPIFIDTLSFEKYEEGKPWVAYKQFCEHFLAPLALIAYTDGRLSKLSQLDVDGIPLDLAAKLLPLKAKFNPGLLLHVFLHARDQQRFSGESLPTANSLRFSRHAFLALIDSLESCVKNLEWKAGKTVWTDYYGEGNCVSYEDKALTAKKKLVADFLEKAGTSDLWDIGANAGLFSRVAAGKGIDVISMDYDRTVVEQNYLRIKKDKEKKILPLVIDLSNPTPGIGWHNRERDPILARPLPDTILALALIHHLAIGKNLPFAEIARLFSEIGQSLIIEFVPKEDRQTKLLLQSREDIFAGYNQPEFEAEFGKFFEIKEKLNIPESSRFLYLMTRK
jgi:ribosomal protein L11 methylase PrmA